MCFDLDSRPPIAPIAGGALDASLTTLTAAEGNRLAAFHARAARPTGAGIVVLPDVRGLHRYYEELALRFAEHGVDALAIDYFGRTAGIGRRDADFDYRSHLDHVHYSGLTADIRAGAAFLRSPDGGTVRSLFTVGFCFGGRLAFLSATLGLELGGAIGFYGWPVGPSRGEVPAPADVADRIACPLLGVFGGADQGIPATAIEAFRAALERAGVEHEITTYAGAPHSFFDRKADEFSAASADAWTQVRSFIDGHAAR